MNPRAPGLNAVNAKNIVRRQTRLSSLRNAESAFMHHVQILVKKEVLDLGSDNGSWYCKAECGLSSGAVLNDHKAVQCDMWVHNDCSYVTYFQYETMQNSSCTWICPKCDFFNFSDSFFSEQLNLEDQNRFISFAKDGETRTPSTRTNNYKFVSCLKFSSINVNGMRSKKLSG